MQSIGLGIALATVLVTSAAAQTSPLYEIRVGAASTEAAANAAASSAGIQYRIDPTILPSGGVAYEVAYLSFREEPANRWCEAMRASGWRDRCDIVPQLPLIGPNAPAPGSYQAALGPQASLNDALRAGSQHFRPFYAVYNGAVQPRSVHPVVTGFPSQTSAQAFCDKVRDGCSVFPTTGPRVFPTAEVVAAGRSRPAPAPPALPPPPSPPGPAPATLENALECRLSGERALGVLGNRRVLTSRDADMFTITTHDTAGLTAFGLRVTGLEVWRPDFPFNQSTLISLDFGVAEPAMREALAADGWLCFDQTTDRPTRTGRCTVDRSVRKLSMDGREASVLCTMVSGFIASTSRLH